MGYLRYVIFQSIGTVVIHDVFFVIMGITIGGCIFLSYLPDDLEHSVRKLDNQLNAVQYRKLSARERIEMTKQLTHIIRFYGKARELSDSKTGWFNFVKTFLLTKYRSNAIFVWNTETIFVKLRVYAE